MLSTFDSETRPIRQTPRAPKDTDVRTGNALVVATTVPAHVSVAALVADPRDPPVAHLARDLVGTLAAWRACIEHRNHRRGGDGPNFAPRYRRRFQRPNVRTGGTVATQRRPPLAPWRTSKPRCRCGRASGIPAYPHTRGWLGIAGGRGRSLPARRRRRTSSLAGHRRAGRAATWAAQAG